MGIAMDNVSSAYESKKPRLEGVDIDPMAKELLDKNWEVSLLRSQLADAQMKIKELTVTDNERDGMKENPSDEISYLSGSLLCLKRISFECKPGELIAVVGGVGCGKYVEVFWTPSLFVKTYLANSFFLPFQIIFHQYHSRRGTKSFRSYWSPWKTRLLLSDSLYPECDG
jgi:hypothetical protein